jgi:hypothetical protein
MPKRRRVSKAALLRKIRVAAESAFHLRKSGHIANAHVHEDVANRAIDEARNHGWYAEAVLMGQDRATKRKWS